MHPVNNANLIVDGKYIGYIALLHPQTLDAIDKKSAVAVLEIDFTDFAQILPDNIVLELDSKYQKTTLNKQIIYLNIGGNLLWQRSSV